VHCYNRPDDYRHGSSDSAVTDFTAFGSMERSGWGDAARATGYVELFSSASDQAIDSLLDAVGAKPDIKALDLCCGQGNVAETLLRRGCEVVGVDFSPAMLAFARGRAPNAAFIEADAQDLPFDDAEFDVVVSNLGVCHVPDQPRALAQARRVLRPAGKFAMTVWCGPDASPCFAAVYRTIKAHGHPDVSIPAGPDFHQFATRDQAVKLLSDVGFSNVDVSIVDCAWDLDAPEDLFEIYAKGTVRVATMLAQQPAQNFAAIRSALASAVRQQFANGNRWRVPVPAALVSATA
jgi:ubiquinone/menaquinone biosynthesis C-methylase UbiE